MMLLAGGKYLDLYADPYGDSAGWTRSFEMNFDLRVFRKKEKYKSGPASAQQKA